MGKGSYVTCEQRRSRSACASVQSDLGILCTSTYTTVSIDSVSGQRRPRSACANAQADLGLRYPRIPKGPFLCVAYHMHVNDQMPSVYGLGTQLALCLNIFRSVISRDGQRRITVRYRFRKNASWEEQSFVLFCSIMMYNFVFNRKCTGETPYAICVSLFYCLGL